MGKPIRTVDCVMNGLAYKSTYTDYQGRVVVVIHWRRSSSPNGYPYDQKIYGAAAQLFCRAYNQRAREAGHSQR